MAHYPIEALLRAPVEWSSSLAAVSLAAIAWRAPDLLMMTRPVAQGGGGGLCGWALVRFYQGWRVIRYQRGCAERVPVVRLGARSRSGGAVPRSGLFVDGAAYPAAVGCHPRRQSPLRRSRASRVGRPPESGLPALHGVGLLEGEGGSCCRAPNGRACLLCRHHRRGQDPALELAARQDIRNGHPVICMDPKGDPALFRCLARRSPAGETPVLLFFHLGYPEHSARYNPIGRFSRLTEVATRIANQLPSQGNAEAFRQFAWLFTHMVGQALFALGNGRITARPSST